MSDMKFEANMPKQMKSSPTPRAAKFALLGTTALCAASLAAAPTRAEPTGGTVIGGVGTIAQSGAVTTVDQTSHKLSLTWTSLDVGEAESLVFNQPGADAIALNRILSDLPTNILGNLTANGNVWIVNPNGIAFGPNSTVDVGGLLASTKDIIDSEFWADDFSFSALTGSEVEYSRITADGTILAGKGGVVLVAPVVEASGLITTNGGDVALATARAFRVDFDGDGLLSFTVEAGAEGVLQLSESSVISAQGGAVYLSAGAADAVTESVVNVGGLIESTQVEQRGGEIILSGGLGGEVIVTAELSAPGGAGQTGGSIDVFGDAITLASGASLDVSGEAGGGSIRVGGDYQGGGDAPTANSTWVTADAMLNADATVDGDGGTVIVWSDQTTIFQGSLSATGAGFGGGGFAEVSGKENLGFYGAVDLSADNGAWGTLLLDPNNLTIIHGETDDTDDVIADGLGDGIIESGLGGMTGNDNYVVSDATLNAIDANISLSAANDIFIQEGVYLTLSGSFTLDAGRDIEFSNLNPLEDDIEITAVGAIIFNAVRDISVEDEVIFSNAPSVAFNAGQDFEITANNLISSDGSLTFNASGSITVGNNSPISSGGSLIFDSGDSITVGNNSPISSSGSITFSATNDISIGVSVTVTASGGVTLDAGDDIAFDEDVTIDATGSISLVADAEDAPGAAAIQFGDGATLISSGGSVEIIANANDTNNNDVVFQGDVDIDASTTIQITSLDAVLLGDDAAENSITLTASGGTTITAQGGVTIRSSNASNTSVLVDGSDLSISMSEGGLTLEASASLSVTNGDATISGLDVDIASSASITVAGAGTLTFIASSTTLDMTLGDTGGFDLTDAEIARLSAGEMSFQTVGGDITVDTLSISSPSSVELIASGSVSFDGSSTISAALDVVATGAVTVGSGLVEVITVNGDTTIDAAGAFTVSDDATFAVDGTATITAAGDFSLGVSATLGVTGTATIESNDVVFGGGSSLAVSGGGTGTLVFVNADEDLMTVGGSGVLGEWDISDAELAALSADSVEFQTSGSIMIDSVSQASGTSDLIFAATDDITFSGTSVFNDVIDATAGVGDGTGSISFASGSTTFGTSATASLTGYSITDDGGVILTVTNTISLDLTSTGPLGSGTVTLDDYSNVFLVPANVTAVGDVILHGSGTLYIGEVYAHSVEFDADDYDTSGASVTVTTTATLFFGTQTVTVTDVGGDPNDELNLNNVDDDDFGFVLEGVAGVGTEGNIIVRDASWSRGIRLVSTSGTVTFEGSTNSFSGAVSIEAYGDISHATDGGTMELIGDLTVTGDASFESASGNITLDNESNFFGGTINATTSDATATITIVNGSAGTTTLGDISSSGDFSLDASGPTEIEGAVSTGGTGSFSIIAAGDVTSGEDASFAIGGATHVTIDGATNSTVALVSTGNEPTSFSGTVTIDVVATSTISMVELGGSGLIDADVTSGFAGTTGSVGLSAFNEAASDEVDVTVDTSVVLEVVSLSGGLTLDANGSISQDSTALLIGGTATFTAASTTEALGTIVLANAENDFNEVEIVQAASVDLADTNSITLDMPTDTQLSLMAETATVTSSGNLTDSDSGTIDVGTLIVDAAGTVTFDNASNDFGSVSATATSIDLYDSADGIELAGVSTTGDFYLETSDPLDDPDPEPDPEDFGDVTQSAPLLIGGTTTIIADGGSGNIKLNLLGNDFASEVYLTGNEIVLLSSNPINFAAGGIVAEDLSISVGSGSFIVDANAFSSVTNSLEFVAISGQDFLIGGANYTSSPEFLDSNAPLGPTETAIYTTPDGGTFDFGASAGATIFDSTDFNGLAAPTVGFVTDGSVFFDGAVFIKGVTVDAGGYVGFVTGNTTVATDTTGLSASESNTFTNLTVTGAQEIFQFVDVDNPHAFDFGADNAIGGIDANADSNSTDSLTAYVVVSGKAIFNATGSVTLNSEFNDFSTLIGAVSGSANSFNINDTTSIALGELNATGSIIVTADNTIYVNDSLTSTAGSVSLTGSSMFDNVTGDTTIAAFTTITIDASGAAILDQTTLVASTSIDIDAGTTTSLEDVSGGSVDIDATGSVTLGGVLNATNAITVDSGGTIFVNNSITSSAGSVSLAAAAIDDNANGGDDAISAFTTIVVDASGDVDLNQTALAATTSFDIDAGSTASLEDVTGGLLDIDATSSVTLGGAVDVSSLSVSTTSTISDGGATGTAIVVSGATTLQAGAASAIDLDDPSNNFNSLAVTTGGSLDVADINGIVLAGVNLGATGTLTVNANTGGGSGTITQTAAITAGATTLDAGDDRFDDDGEVDGSINLLDPGNSFGSISVTDAHNVSILDTTQITSGGIEADGELRLDSVSGVSTINALEVGGTTDINASGANVFITSDNNTFGGAVMVDGATVDIHADSGGIDLGSSNISGNFDLTSAGAVTDSGAVKVTGTTDIDAAGFEVTLNNDGTDFDGVVNVSGTNVTLIDADSLQLGDIDATVALTAEAKSGSITDNNAVSANAGINVTGATSLTATSFITLDDSVNDFGGAVTVTANGAVSLRDTNAILLGDVFTNGGNLTVVASALGGATAISQSGSTTLDVGGASFTATTTGDIILENDNQFSGTVKIVTANDASITASGSLTLGAVTSLNFTGDLTLVADSITATGAITVPGALTVTINDGTFNSTYEVNVTGLTDINAADEAVSLTNTLNTFVGAVSIDAEDVTLSVDGSGIVFGESAITGDFDLTTTGSVDQVGAITGGASVTVIVEDSDVAIDLLHNGALLDADNMIFDSDLANNFTYFALAGSSDAISLELRDASGSISFGDLDVLGDFSLEVVGDVNSTDEFHINGSTFIEVTGDTSSVTLNNDSSTFGVDVGDSLTVIANSDVTLVADSIVGTVTLNGDSVSLTADTVVGNVGVTATSDITVEVTSLLWGNATLYGDGVSMSATTVFGNVGVTATDDVDIAGGTYFGVIDVDGSSGASDVTIDVVSLSGRVDVTGHDVDINSDGIVLLGDLVVGHDLDVDANNVKNATATVNAATVVIKQADGTTIEVAGDATFDANGGDIDLLNGVVKEIILSFSTPDQPNSFGGEVTINNANDIYLGASSELKIASADSDQSAEPGEIVLLAPDMGFTGSPGSVSAPVIYLAGSSGSTKLGGEDDDGTSNTNWLDQGDLENVDASDFLQIIEAGTGADAGKGDVEVLNLSLSGELLGYANSSDDLGLLILADGNVLVSGFVTSTSVGDKALDLQIEATNIYVSGKLGVADFDGGDPDVNSITDPEMMPLGDLTLWAVNDVLIGSTTFVGVQNSAQLEGPNVEIDLNRVGEVLVHTVGEGAFTSQVTFGGARNIAMQTTDSQVGTGLEIGELTLIQGKNGGSPEFVNLFGAVTFNGSRVDGIQAAGGININQTGPSLAYEMNGCIIGPAFVQCTPFGTILTTIPFDESLFLDLDIEPEEEEEDDPFTNRGNEEEWR